MGGSAVGFLLGQRLSPALTDALFSIRRLGVDAQKADRPDNGVDNLDAPVDGTAQVHGTYPGPVLRHSLFTRLLARAPRPGDVVTAAMAGLRGLRRPPEPAGAARQPVG